MQPKIAPTIKWWTKFSYNGNRNFASNIFTTFIIISSIIVIMKFEKRFIECSFYLGRTPYYANMVYQSFCQSHHKSHNESNLFAHTHAICVGTCRAFNTHVDIIIISTGYLCRHTVFVYFCPLFWMDERQKGVSFRLLLHRLAQNNIFDTHIFQLINTMTQLMRFSLHTARMS